MTGFALLDIAIGVLFAVLVFSLIASAMQEALASVLAWRGAALKAGVLNLIGGEVTNAAFWRHPLIQGLRGPNAFFGARPPAGGGRAPSRIPARTFATALIDVARHSDAHLARLKSAGVAVESATLSADRVIEDLALGEDVKDRLRRALGDIRGGVRDAEARLAELQGELETWFDDAMDRVTGWYVRRVKLVLFIFGALMALVVNFDVIDYAGDLVRDTELRARMVAQAELVGALDPARIEAAGLGETLTASLDRLQADLADQGAALGWRCAERAFWACVGAGLSWSGVVSWALIGFACTLGGQFWFDLLQNLLRVRSGVVGGRRRDRRA